MTDQIKTDEMERRVKRLYMQQYRNSANELGLIQFNTTIAEADRDYFLAQAEHSKADHLMKLVDNGDVDLWYRIGRKRIVLPPSTSTMEAMLEDAKDKEVRLLYSEAIAWNEEREKDLDDWSECMPDTAEGMLLKARATVRAIKINAFLREAQALQTEQT